MRSVPCPPEPPPGLTLESVLRHYGSFVRHKLRDWGVPVDQIADVQQEVFLVVAARLPGFVSGPDGSLDQALKSWLAAIVVRKAWAFRGSLKRRGHEVFVPGEELEAIAGSHPTAEDGLAERERWEALCKLVNGLLPERRAVLVGFCFEDKSMHQVAAELGISVNTAWTRLRLAREDLQAGARRLAARESNAVLALIGLFFAEERNLASAPLPLPVHAPAASEPQQPRPGGRLRLCVTAAALLLGLWLMDEAPLPPSEPPSGAPPGLAASPTTAAPATATRLAPPAPTFTTAARNAEQPPLAPPRPRPAQVIGRAPQPSRPSPRRGDQAYFEEARDLLGAGRPEVVEWALTTHAPGFAIDALAPERESLSLLKP